MSYKWQISKKKLVANKYVYGLSNIYSRNTDLTWVSEKELKGLLKDELVTNAVLRSNRVVEIYDLVQGLSELRDVLSVSNKLYIRVIRDMETRKYLKIYNSKGLDITIELFNAVERYFRITKHNELSIPQSNNGMDGIRLLLNRVNMEAADIGFSSRNNLLVDEDYVLLK
ncbi:MAG: hypothetical protein IJE45_04720 [Bacilli bacterium]|nr:hypothetical protein [Bacilli bacterium]